MKKPTDGQKRAQAAYSAATLDKYQEAAEVIRSHMADSKNESVVRHHRRDWPTFWDALDELVRLLRVLLPALLAVGCGEILV